MKPMTPQETLTQWMEQSAAVRARMQEGGGKPGLARPEQVAGKTGMEVMQAMLAGELPYPHIAETLDFALIEVEPGKATFQGTPLVKHLNPMGTVDAMEFLLDKLKYSKTNQDFFDAMNT